MLRLWPRLQKPRLLFRPFLRSMLLSESIKEAEQPDSDSPARLSNAQWQLHEQAGTRAFGKEYFGVLDDNTDMIVAFASYSREVSDQEQPSWRSHTPYGLVRRPLAGESPAFEVIGPMYRPQWEDRWHVLDDGGLISSWDDGPAEPAVSGPLSSELAAQPIAPRPTGKQKRPLPLATVADLHRRLDRFDVTPRARPSIAAARYCIPWALVHELEPGMQAPVLEGERI